jgi:YGGT family
MDEDRVVVRRSEPRYYSGGLVTDSVEETSVRRTPSGAEVARRVVVFIFGIIQLLIVLRMVLLLLDADRSNGLVSAIYDISAVLVAPFQGILQTDALRSNGSVFDVAALVALIGWTVLEAVILAGIAIARREP